MDQETTQIPYMALGSRQSQKMFSLIIFSEFTYIKIPLKIVTRHRGVLYERKNFHDGRIFFIRKLIFYIKVFLFFNQAPFWGYFP